MPKKKTQKIIDKNLDNEEIISDDINKTISDDIDLYENFSTIEWEDLAYEMETFHRVFSIMWRMGKPIYYNKIPTACVEFNQNGVPLVFKFNKDFWKSISVEQKKFIIAHECLHIIFMHGFRAFCNKSLSKSSFYSPQILNIACDLVVNHTLVNNYGFDREEVDPTSKYCWIDTIFENKMLEKDGKTIKVQENMNFEYYFNLIKSPSIKIEIFLQNLSGKGTGETVDGHSDGSGESDKEDIKKATKQIINELSDELSDAEKRKLNDIIKKVLDQNGGKKDLDDIMERSRGTEAGNLMFQFKVENIKKKRKWESIIKNWSMKYIKDNIYEQWARRNRRLTEMPQEFFLPSDFEVEHFEKDKIEVYYFQDTSGSCAGEKERFLRAIHSLPEDKFKVRAFCFDTVVYDLDLKTNILKGFGGTTFSILENKIQQIMSREKVEYPKAVFMFTDGYGDRINPQVPENWHIFLTADYRSCFPSTCNFYSFRDYE